VDETAPISRIPKPLSRRAIAIALAFVALFLVAPGIMCIRMAFCLDQTLGLRLAFLIMAAVALFLPGWIAWVSVRRKLKTGSWGASPEERLRWKEKYASHGPPKWFKPMTTILSVVFACEGLAVLIFAKHPDSMTRCMGVLFVTIAASDIWSSYRKRKSKSASEVHS
jgi:hypothetical protein